MMRMVATACLWVCTGLILAATIISFTKLQASTFGDDGNPCEMSYMWPNYIAVPTWVGSRINMPPKNWPRTDSAKRLASAYGLYLYREGQQASKFSISGKPVLFVPGNAGSHKQVRSVASNSHQLTKGTGQVWDFFSIDFDEDLSGLDADVLQLHAWYTNECIRHIFELYEKQGLVAPYSIVVVAHSMGGVVARLALTEANAIPGAVQTIITLASPHTAPPLKLGRNFIDVYQRIHESWVEGEETRNVSIFSICGGRKDYLVNSQDCIFEDESRAMTVFTSDLDQVWTSADHLCILWCKQVVNVISRFLSDLAVAGDISPEERMELFSSRFQRAWSEGPSRSTLEPSRDAHRVATSLIGQGEFCPEHHFYRGEGPMKLTSMVFDKEKFDGVTSLSVVATSTESLSVLLTTDDQSETVDVSDWFVSIRGRSLTSDRGFAVTEKIFALTTTMEEFRYVTLSWTPRHSGRILASLTQPLKDSGFDALKSPDRPPFLSFTTADDFPSSLPNDISLSSAECDSRFPLVVHRVSDCSPLLEGEISVASEGNLMHLTTPLLRHCSEASTTSWNIVSDPQCRYEVLTSVSFLGTLNNLLWADRSVVVARGAVLVSTVGIHTAASVILGGSSDLSALNCWGWAALLFARGFAFGSSEILSVTTDAFLWAMTVAIVCSLYLLFYILRCLLRPLSMILPISALYAFAIMSVVFGCVHPSVGIAVCFLVAVLSKEPMMSSGAVGLLLTESLVLHVPQLVSYIRRQKPNNLLIEAGLLRFPPLLLLLPLAYLAANPYCQASSKVSGFTVFLVSSLACFGLDFLSLSQGADGILELSCVILGAAMVYGKRRNSRLKEE